MRLLQHADHASLSDAEFAPGVYPASARATVVVSHQPGLWRRGQNREATIKPGALESAVKPSRSGVYAVPLSKRPQLYDGSHVYAGNAGGGAYAAADS